MTAPPIYFYDPGDAQYVLDHRRTWETLNPMPLLPLVSELSNNESAPLTWMSSEGADKPCIGRFVCLIHFSRLDHPAECLKVWTEAHPSARFIVISGVPPEPIVDLPDNILFYRQPVGDLEGSAFLSEFGRWYAAWSKDDSNAWEPMSQDLQLLYAIRLLCDASRMAPNYDGTPIHAPSNSVEWSAALHAKDLTFLNALGQHQVAAMELFASFDGPRDAAEAKVQEFLAATAV